MLSTIKTFPCMDGATQDSVVEFSVLTCFSIAFINALFVEQCNIEPSNAKRDHGTRENSYTPTASAMLISGHNFLPSSCKLRDIYLLVAPSFFVNSHLGLLSCGSPGEQLLFLHWWPQIFFASLDPFFYKCCEELGPCNTGYTDHFWLPPALLLSSPG